MHGSVCQGICLGYGCKGYMGCLLPHSLSLMEDYGLSSNSEPLNFLLFNLILVILALR